MTETMIVTIIQIAVRRLLHNPVELLVAFVVPIIFFSIFAVIFGNGVGIGSSPKIKVAVVDLVKTDASRALLTQLRDAPGLRIVKEFGSDHVGATGDQSEQAAKEAVKRGSVPIAIVLREREQQLGVDLLTDPSDQVAPQIAAAMVQQQWMKTASARSSTAGPFALASARPNGKTGPLQQANATEDTGAVMSAASDVLPTVHVIDVVGANKSSSVVTMYAAGIAVMFLLFGASGAGGALIEERENQTLARLLSTGLTLDQLLLGKWFYMTGLGFVQVTIMFVWGQLAFGVDLLGHLDGFIIMTAVTSGAASALGLLLATLCKTRGQLNGLSVVVILTMSALGGSMVPRYVMSQSLRDAGLWTFNAWALDGYDKVFWRDMPALELWPQMSVLMISGTVFLFLARLSAVRWETE